MGATRVNFFGGGGLELYKLHRSNIDDIFINY